MSTLEQDLTQAMTRYAEGAPDDLGLLSRVQAGSRRRTRNRRVGLVLGAAAAVVAVVAVTTSPFGLPKAQSQYADPTGFLVDSRDLALRFPLTPSYLPPGLGDRPPLIEETGHHGSAQYLLGSSSGVQVAIYHSEKPIAQQGTATTVDGRTATQWCDTRGCNLAWQRGPSFYVMVWATGPGSAAAGLPVARQVAESLRDEPIVHRPTLVLGLTPAEGCMLVDPHGLRTSMNPVDLQGARATCPVTAAVYTTEEAAAAGFADRVGEPTSVGGYQGWLQERDSSLPVRRGDPSAAPSTETLPLWVAVLELRDGRRLAVSTPRTGGWNREALDRFVRAIIVPSA